MVPLQADEISHKLKFFQGLTIFSTYSEENLRCLLFCMLAVWRIPDGMQWARSHGRVEQQLAEYHDSQRSRIHDIH